MRLLAAVHDAVLTDDFPVQIAEQREWNLQLLGERRVSAVTLDAQPQNLSAQLSKFRVVLTERTQLAGSNAAEVEHVPEQDNRAAGKAVRKRD
jgi:hypothetical protein